MAGFFLNLPLPAMQEPDGVFVDVKLFSSAPFVSEFREVSTFQHSPPPPPSGDGTLASPVWCPGPEHGLKQG